MVRCRLVVAALVVLNGCTSARSIPSVSAPPIVIAFLGDSLTRGAQLDVADHYPALLERRFAEVGIAVLATNAGHPGETTVGGLARIDAELETNPDVLFVALGVNDYAAGIASADSERSLSAIVERASHAGAIVVLAGATLSVAGETRSRASQIVTAVARVHGTWLVDDLLEGVAGVSELNLADGIHPNTDGQRRVAENVWPVLFSAVVELTAARQKE